MIGRTLLRRVRSLWVRIRHRTRALVRRGSIEREMDEEMRVHHEMEIEDRIRSGMDPMEARRTALRDFGGVERFKEESRAALGVAWLDSLVQDLRFGLRILRRRPMLAALAVLTLAAGIAFPTAAFSVADTVLHRPPEGVPDPDRLVQVRFRSPHDSRMRETGLSHLNLRDLGEAALPTVTHLVGSAENSYQVVTPDGAARHLHSEAVEGDYFGALGVSPAKGRLLSAAETVAGPAVAVLSEEAARRLFGEGSAVGRRLHVNGASLTVVGVAGNGFRGVHRGRSTDLWVPHGLHPTLLHVESDTYHRRDASTLFNLVARLRSGARAEAAENELREAMERLVEAYPEQNGRYADYQPTLYRYLGIRPSAREWFRRSMLILVAAAFVVLLVACANVASLLVFNGLRREGESAVRQAIGASRPRLVRQHITEGALLVGAGLVLGAAAAAWLSREMISEGINRYYSFSFEGAVVEGRVLAFAAACGGISVLLAALLPALVVPRVDLVASLKVFARKRTGGRGRLRAGLFVTQIALSLSLVVSALLLRGSLRNLQEVELGFESAGLMEVALDPRRQGLDQAQLAEYQRELLRGVATIPGLHSVAGVGDGPLRAQFRADLRPGGEGGGWPIEAWAEHVTPGFFGTLGVPILRGRDFTADDLERSWESDAGVAVVNEALARRLSGTVEAVGLEIVQRGYRENRVLEVVGVVADSRMRDLRGERDSGLYRPLGDSYHSRTALLLRSDRPSAEVIEDVRGVVNGIGLPVPFQRAAPLTDLVDELTTEERLLARLMTLLSIVAVGLAGVGLYGAVASSVEERVREIGIRKALGARMSEIAGQVIGEVLRLTAFGLVAGAFVGWGAARLLENRLFRIEPLEPRVWFAAVVACVVLAVAAAALPARAAARVDIVRTLKG